MSLKRLPSPSVPAEVMLSLSRSRSAASASASDTRSARLHGVDGAVGPPPACEAELELERQLSMLPEDLYGPPPDGGLTAYLVVVSSMLLLFAIFGLMNATGQLLAYYLDHQLKGYAKSTVSWIGSVQTLVEFSFAMATGRWFDNHGAQWLTIVGVTLGTASVVALAFSYEFYHFFLSMALFGFAGSMVFAPANAVAAHWFLRYRSTAIACISGGAGLGGVIYPIMIDRLLMRLSYRNTMLVIAAFNFALMLPSCFFMKARLPPRKPPPLSYLKRPWRDPKFVFLVISGMLYGMNILSPFIQGIMYARANALPPRISNYAIAIAGSGSVVGRLVMGVIADRLGVWHVFTCVPFGTAISIFAFWVPPHIGTGPTIAGLVTYGWMSGGFFALMGSATASFSPIEEVGTRIGLLISSIAVPSFVGPVITGALIKPDKFTYAGLWLGCCFLASGVMLNAPTDWLWIRKNVFRCDGGHAVDLEGADHARPAASGEKQRLPGR